MTEDDGQLPEISGIEGRGDRARPPEGHQPAPGARIDDFEILEEIGRGGMGVVYRARERALDRVVALKILDPRVRENPSAAKRFRREAVLAGNLTHPNIVRVYHIDSRTPPLYFTMEYVPGCSLKDKVQAEGFLTPQKAVRIALQVCDALRYAHDRSIIHRDIKPGNILLENHLERVHIADFGIAQDLTGELSDMTQTEGLTGGTPAFMSPEQNLGEQLSIQTDIFSLGMTIYHMLTGQTAYRAKNRVALAEAFRRQRPLPPSHFNADVPAALDRVVMTMIAVDPARRYGDCADVAADLAAAIAGRPVSAEMKTPTQRSGRRTARRWMLAGALVLLLVCGVWTTAWLLTSGADTRPGEVGPRPPKPVLRQPQDAAESHTLAVVREFSLPLNPTGGMALTSDERHLFISAHAEGDHSQGTVYVIDADSLKTVATIHTGYDPLRIAVSPDGNVAYVTNTQKGYHATKFDTKSFKSLGDVPTGTDSGDAVFSRDGKTVYMVNHWSPFLSVIDATTNEPAGKITGIDHGARGLALTPDGTMLFVLGRTANIYKVSTATRKVVKVIETSFGGSGAIQIQLAPDGRHILIAGDDSNGLHKYSLATDREVGSADLKTITHGLDQDASGRFAYVALPETNEVAIVRAADMKILGKVRVGRHPRGIVVSPAKNRAYVANHDSKTISVLDLTLLENVARSSAGAVASESEHGSLRGFGGTPDRAIDGDRKNGWHSGRVPCWLQVDLGQPRKIRLIRLWCPPRTQSYSLSASKDGLDWHTVATGTCTPPMEQGLPTVATATLDWVLARHIRVEILRSDSPATHMFKAGVVEVEVFAPVEPQPRHAADLPDSRPRQGP